MKIDSIPFLIQLFQNEIKRKNCTPQRKAIIMKQKLRKGNISNKLDLTTLLIFHGYFKTKKALT